ncbi:hypothetical protein [Neobacillus sp. LXY-4]|uniref:hypothetical protein n=1 Tax=Neobacillus sp. LXY-4 TaxID=3379826 RepID=UPI003EE311D3
MSKSRLVNYLLFGVLGLVLIWIIVLGSKENNSTTGHISAKQLNSEKVSKNKVTTAEFKGNIYRDLETHYYVFSTTKKGKIDVTWGPDTTGSDFLIANKDWSGMYYNGDVLPAGDYMFVVTSNPAETPDDPALLRYHFTINGLTFKEAPDPTLPQLEIESPQELVTRLPAGEQVVTFKGSSDGVELTLGTFGFENEVVEPLTSPFEKTITFNEASPYSSSYRISATNQSGNMVNRYFEFIYEGGVME